MTVLRQNMENGRQKIGILYSLNAMFCPNSCVCIVKNACVEGRKEGNVLFNNALNTFTVIWSQTYGKGPLR